MKCLIFQASPPKHFTESFVPRKEIPPTAQAKFKEEYPSLSNDWKEIYSLAFNVTLDTILRVFQYKLLNRIIFTLRMINFLNSNL